MNPHSRLEACIGAIVADDALHARWLNTFSYLEYVGFRKIVKSQRAEALTAEILTHALEEGRHALGLKKIALKIGGEAFANYAPETMLCGDEAEDYFQSLDGACDEAFADRPEALRAKLVYCYVTWLIERRALQVYGLYKDALGSSPVAGRIAGLLMEEEKHLSDVEAEIGAADPDFATRAPKLEAIEATLYERFIDALVAALARPKTLAAASPDSCAPPTPTSCSFPALADQARIIGKAAGTPSCRRRASSRRAISTGPISKPGARG